MTPPLFTAIDIVKVEIWATGIPRMNYRFAEKPNSISSEKPSLGMRALKTKILARQIEKKRLLKIGNLVARAELDHLDAQTLYGALVTIKEMTELRSNLNFWKRLGKEHFIPEE